MTKYSTVLVIGIFQLAGILSCTEEVKPVPFTYTKVFTGEHSRTWKVTFLEQTLNGDVNDTFTLSCTSDDLYIFYANPERTLEVSTGSKHCSTGEPISIVDSWSFNNATATLIMVVPFLADGSLPMIVREASSNKLVLEIFFDETNTESYRVHFEKTDED